MDDDFTFMYLAMEEAEKAAARDEVPVGAVLVHTQTRKVIAKDGNRTREHTDPSAHAEILVIRQGCRIENAQRIPDCDLYVTLEPCTMCASAISFARIRRIIYGAPDPKGGGIDHGSRFYTQPTCHHKPEVISGILADESSQLLKRFFQSKR